MGWETLIPIIVTFIIGLICPSPVFKRIFKIGWEVVEFGYKLFGALKKDPDGTHRLDEEEYEMLKREFNDIVLAVKDKGVTEEPK